ncbi:MAG TPA: ATP-binding protein, partial [Chloroflexia bacterium]|nr:ATP-binding protein [Chloroflexia bacterium]
LHGANVHCDFKLAPDLWAVEVDAGQFAQVIQNLVLNAVQAMPEGGKIEIGAGNVEIAESTHEVGLLLPAGKYVKLYIQDEGSGIEPEFLPKIFDPYFTTKQKGSGLGLAVCYAVLKKHDGLITVESVVGKGTTFYLYLPASTRPDMVTVKQEAAIEPLIRGKGRILVMDDEASLRQLVARLLDKMGYQGEVVQNGQEAVEQYQMALQRGEPFDLVLLDMTIPGGMGGKQTLARLKEIDPSVKAIICSGYSNDPVMGNYSDYGFVGVLLKPFRAQELNKLLQKFLDQENQTQAE